MQYVYWFLSPKLVDCLSPQTQYSTGRLVTELVLEEEKLPKDSIFRLETKQQKLMIFRLDVVESILRRGFYGFQFKRVRVKEG